MASYGMRLITAPTVEPVSLAEAKGHCNVTRTDQDTWFTTAIAAARQKVEEDTGRQLVYATYDLDLDGFPSGARGIKFPRAPLQDVVSVLYYDTTNTQVPLASSKYHELIYRLPGELVLAYGQTWPSTYPRPGAVTIRFDCGNASNDIDSRAKAACLLLIGNWYMNREAAIVGATAAATPLAYQSLVNSLSIGDEFECYGERREGVSA